MGQTTSTPVLVDKPAKCPIDHTQFSKGQAPTPPPQTERPAQCPIQHQESAPAKCPIDHSQVNPLNQMPAHIPQHPLSSDQATNLPTQRTVSSIPRPNQPSDDKHSDPSYGASARWLYPSPQQFYNALVRKGWDTPEEHVETMVDIHNFLNEEAWNEVLKWERDAGVKEEHINEGKVELARFMGKPGVMSPKARFWMLAGWLLPTRFNTEAPFDRHDWIVRRPLANGTSQEVRYVIDYYSAPPEPDGSPCFNLDVRPALDSVGSVTQRVRAATEEVWTAFKEGK